MAWKASIVKNKDVTKSLSASWMEVWVLTNWRLWLQWDLNCAADDSCPLEEFFKKKKKLSRISLQCITGSVGTVKDSVLAHHDLLFLHTLLLLLVPELLFSTRFSGVDFSHDLASCLYGYFLYFESRMGRRSGRITKNNITLSCACFCLRTRSGFSCLV